MPALIMSVDWSTDTLASDVRTVEDCAILGYWNKIKWVQKRREEAKYTIDTLLKSSNRRAWVDK